MTVRTAGSVGWGMGTSKGARGQEAKVVMVAGVGMVEMLLGGGWNGCGIGEKVRPREEGGVEGVRGGVRGMQVMTRIRAMLAQIEIHEGMLVSKSIAYIMRCVDF